MKKHGITEIKQAIDLAHLIWTFKQRKFNFWTLIFGNWKKLKQAIDEGIELWHDKAELWEEIKDLDPEELLELNRYVKDLFGINENVTKFVEHLVNGTQEYIEAYRLLQSWKSKCKHQ